MAGCSSGCVPIRAEAHEELRFNEMGLCVVKADVPLGFCKSTFTPASPRLNPINEFLDAFLRSQTVQRNYPAVLRMHRSENAWSVCLATWRDGKWKSWEEQKARRSLSCCFSGLVFGSSGSA